MKIHSDHLISNQSSKNPSPFKLRSGKRIQWEPSLLVESLLKEMDKKLSLLDKVENFYQNQNMPNLKHTPPPRMRSPSPHAGRSPAKQSLLETPSRLEKLRQIMEARNSPSSNANIGQNTPDNQNQRQD